MSVPDRPFVQMLVLYVSGKMVIAGDKYRSAGGETHTTTGVQLRDSSGSTVHDDQTLPADRRHTITGLTLTPGEVYSARMRYENSAGWGPYSPWYAERVPFELNYTEASVPALPGDGGALPHAPSFPQAVPVLRSVHDRLVDSGQSHRRPASLQAIRRAELIWEHLTESEKDTLVAFIEARIEAAEAFTDSTEALGSNAWLAEAGTIHIELGTRATWTVSVQALEVVLTS